MRVGIDTGGTFTDLVLVADDGQTLRRKVPSTPSDPAEALVGGLRRALEAAGGAPPSAIAHGTTVATNAMLEQRFQALALLTTRGFRHVLEIARPTPRLGRRAAEAELGGLEDVPQALGRDSHVVLRLGLAGVQRARSKRAQLVKAD